jgi:phosphoglycolate phosphatase-like HAD superfamily hydrolase
MAGDTPYDAQAARAAGIRAVGLLTGGFPEAQLSKAGCEAVYRDPTHFHEEVVAKANLLRPRE